MDSVPALDMIGDWYRLRMGSEMALDWISADRMAMYRLLIEAYKSDTQVQDGGTQTHVCHNVSNDGSSTRSGLPSRNFSVSLQTGRVMRQ